MTTDNAEHLLTQATADKAKAVHEWESTILYARYRGLSVRAIAEAAQVSPQTVLNICARLNASDDSPS